MFNFAEQFFTPSGRPISRVRLYIRVSDEEQVLGHSLAMQEKEDSNFAKRHKYLITGKYIDAGFTGKNMNRPQLKLLLSDIKSKKKDFDAIIVWRCDRLIRNNDYYHSVIKPMFDRADIAILSATENNDMNNPYGKYMRNMQINNAELESDINSIRTIANLREKCEQGYSPVARPPIGYKRVTINKKKLIVPDPETSFYVQKILKLHSTGIYSDRMLAGLMRKEGFSKCTKKMVENITRNNLKFYSGKFDYSLKDYNGIRTTKEYQGKHEPLISIELYETIKKLHKEHVIYASKTTKHELLYKGLIKCPKNNKFLTGEIQKGKNNSGEYEYWRCHKPIKGDAVCNACKKCIKSTIIDNAVIEVLKEIEITPKQLDEIKENFKIFFNIQTDYDEKKKEQIATKIKKLRNRLNQLYEDKLDGLIDQDIYIEKREKYSTELNELNIEYNALSKTNQILFERLEQAFELCKDLTGRYLQLSNSKKRELLKLLCSNFFYQDSKLNIKVKSAFMTLFRTFVFDCDLSDFEPETHVSKNGAPCRSMFEIYKSNFKNIICRTENILLIEEIAIFLAA